MSGQHPLESLGQLAGLSVHGVIRTITLGYETIGTPTRVSICMLYSW